MCGMEVLFQLRPRDSEPVRRGYYRSFHPWYVRLDAATAGSGILIACIGLGTLLWKGHLFPGISSFSAGWMLIVSSSFQRRRALISPGLEGEFSFEFSEAGITVSAAGRFAASRVPWTAFARFAETPAYFLLYSPGTSHVSSLFAYRVRWSGSLYVVPKRSLSSEQVGQMRSLLKANPNPLLKQSGLISKEA
jgi:hypothetical protein